MRNKNQSRLRSAILHALTVTLLMVTSQIVPVVQAEESGNLNQRSWDFSAVRALPVQSGGRIKPFETFARENVLYFTGSNSFQGWDPTDLMLSWMSYPKEWSQVDFFQISNQELKKQLGLRVDQSRFSLVQLLKDSYLEQYLGEVEGASTQAAPITRTSRQNPRSAELKKLVDKISYYQSLITGRAFLVVPAATGENHDRWDVLLPPAETDPKGLVSTNDGTGFPPRESVIQGYTSLLSHYIENRQTEFEEQALALTKILEKQITTKTKVEVIYQRGHFFRWAWMFYLCAALIWWLSRYSQRSLWVTLGLGLTTVGWILHAGGMLLRSYISGRPPVSNMYESMIWVSFGVIFFAGAIYFSQRQRIIFVAATIVSALVLVAADIAPAILDPSIQPLVPVLRSNFWLTIHVLTITLSYAAFALCWGVGNYNLYFFTKNPVPRQTTEQLNQLMYRATQFGVVLLAAGTILGGVWADYSWGRFWGWDPKEVWALIALLGYLIVLHARYTGWMKEYGFALMSVVSFMLVMMAWYGVNFILGAGLHSYGFSQGGQLFVTVVLFFQLVYIGLVEMLRRQRNILEPKQSSGE